MLTLLKMYRNRKDYGCNVMTDQAEKSPAFVSRRTQLVSLKEAARQMFNDDSRTTQQRVQRLCKKKEIPAVQDGRRWWVKIDEVVGMESPEMKKLSDWNTAYRIGLEGMQKIADAGVDLPTGVKAIQEAARYFAAKNKVLRINTIVSEEVSPDALNGLWRTFTNEVLEAPLEINELMSAANKPLLIRKRWIKKNLGDKKKAGEALKALFKRNHWRPQDIADAMNLRGHTVRRYTRGETAFDAAFLLRALHVMAFSPTAGLLPPLTREEN